MKTIIVLTLCVVASFAVPTSTLAKQWAEFKATHNKSYATITEEALRSKIFEENLVKIEAHNERYSKGEVTFQKGMNHFGDMTGEEFLAFVNLGKTSKPRFYNKNKKIYVPTAPKEEQVDWRTKEAVSEVKDQGQCGSCWAFSTTGAIEGQLAIKGAGLVSLSEQNLMDCSQSYGNRGCNGGWMDDGFDYVRDNGINSEKDYPYEALDGDCRFDAANSVTKVSKYTDIASGSEPDLQSAVSEIGPIAVAMDASQELQFYTKGYFFDPTCFSDASFLNHGVLVVGYGNDGINDYWIVKNSWSQAWGDQGYFLLARNEGNNCGIATAASYPTL